MLNYARVLIGSYLEDRRIYNFTINNILLFYHIKQIDSMLLWICKVTDHKRRQNVVRTSLTYSAAPRVSLVLFLPHFDFICDPLQNRHSTIWN